MRKNELLTKLRAGQTTFGLVLTLGSPVMAEETGHAGFDWAMIDNQHGYWSRDTMLAAVQVLSYTATTPLVRVPENNPAQIGQALDMGAFGVVVPLVNTRADAERAVRACRYPPDGARSAGGSRLLLLGDDYFTASNPEVMCTVMLETRQAVAQADEILSVPGVDCAFIGPGDLALDLGTYGRESQEHEDALLAILAAGQRHNVPVGLATGSWDVAKRRAEQGFTFINAGSDIGFFWGGMRALKASIDGYR